MVAMLVSLVGPTKATKAVATSNRTQGKRTQVPTQADASACTRRQLDASIQRDAREPNGRKCRCKQQVRTQGTLTDASAHATGRKCRCKQQDGRK